jgi:acyl carrier protein
MSFETVQQYSAGAGESSGAAAGNNGLAGWGVAEIEEWLVTRLAELTRVNPEEVDVEEPFANFGLNSIDAVSLSGDLEDLLGCSLPATLLWDFPTISELSAYLAEEASPARAAL